MIIAKVAKIFKKKNGSKYFDLIIMIKFSGYDH